MALPYKLWLTIEISLKMKKQGVYYSIDFYRISIVDFRRSKGDCKKHSVHMKILCTSGWLVANQQTLTAKSDLEPFFKIELGFFET
jgi:hypothetical protein